MLRPPPWLARAALRTARVRWRLLRPVTVGVRVLPVRDGRILLVRHTYRPDWHLAGGGVKRGETLEEAVRREAREEAGATLGALSLFGLYSHFAEHKSDHVAVFACRDFEVAGRRSLEIAEVGVFDLEALPPDLSPGTGRRIDELRRNAPGAVVGRW